MTILPPAEEEPPATATAIPAAAIVQAATLTQPTLDPTTYSEMWAWISDRSKAVDAEKLSAFLSELGLSRADELGYCDGAMWEDLAAHLKPIPKRGLLHMLEKNNIRLSWRRTISGK